MQEYQLVVVGAPSLSTSKVLDLRNQITVMIGPGRMAKPHAQLGPNAFAWWINETEVGAQAVYKAAFNQFGTNLDLAIVPSTQARKRLLVCDMDSTIIGQECLDELADYAGLKPQIAAITERAMKGELNFEAALKERVAMLAGLSVTAIEDCYRDRISLNDGARTLVRTMASNGARCILVSGGFTAFTGRVAQAAGFHDDYANTLHDDGDCLSGTVEEPILGREAKLETLQKEAVALGLSNADAIAIGDGANDLAMIGAAGLGVAYRAKPVVADQADCAINHTSLETALYFQGYHESEFVRDEPPL